MQPSAKVILDSISPEGVRLTTLEIVIHRFVLSELNTHRVFSRNSASSRAIPVSKQLQRVYETPAIPVVWPAEQSGMQGGAELDSEAQKAAEYVWLTARDDAMASAQDLVALGVHKSIANRLLEPFQYHTVIVTATDWDGFWHQRVSPLAQPEIRVAAEAMKAAYDASTPQQLGLGEWHTPYILPEEYGTLPQDKLLSISAARCARVSYLTHDGIKDNDADFALYERLVTADPAHASPLEHVATPCVGHVGGWQFHEGNLKGWDQLRHRVIPS